MAEGQRADALDELLQKLFRVHKHCEVTADDRYECFPGRFHRVYVVSIQGGRSSEVLCPLEDKHRDRELQAEFRGALEVVCDTRRSPLSVWPSTSSLRSCTESREPTSIKPRVSSKNWSAPSKLFAHLRCTA